MNSSKSDFSPPKIKNKAKINIASSGVGRERKRSNAELVKNQSYPHFISQDSTVPETDKGVKRVKVHKFNRQISKRARIEDDIVKWSLKKSRVAFQNELNPYDLKEKIFDAYNNQTQEKPRCKSVLAFDKQLKRPGFKGDMD